MTIFKKRRVANSEKNKYANAEHFRQVFSHDMDVLYRLSFLLTGDHEKAEQCFVAGIEDSVNTNQVFKEWARTWAKRTIIQNAIHCVRPRPHQEVASLNGYVVFSDEPQSIPDRDLVMNGVLALETFERFVFVITVLEGYSEHECGLFLHSSVRDVRNARIRATEQIAAAASSPTSAAHSSILGEIENGLALSQAAEL